MAQSGHYAAGGSGSGAPQPPAWPPTFPPQPPTFHPQQTYQEQNDHPAQLSYSYHPLPAPQPPAFDLGPVYGQPVYQPSYRGPPQRPLEYYQPNYTQPPAPPPLLIQQARVLAAAHSAGPNDFGPGSGNFVQPHSADQVRHQATFVGQHGVVPTSTGGLNANLLFAHADPPPPLHVEEQQQQPSGHRLPYFSPFLNSVVPELSYISPPAIPKIYFQTPTQQFEMPLAFPPLAPKFVPPSRVPSDDADKNVPLEYDSPPAAPELPSAPSPSSFVAPPPATIASPTPSFDFQLPPTIVEHEERRHSTHSIALERSNRESLTPESLYAQEESYTHDQRRTSLEVPRNQHGLPKPPSPNSASYLPSSPHSHFSPSAQRTPPPALEAVAESCPVAEPLVPDNVVYSYALRVAILFDILSTQPTLPKSSSPSSASLHRSAHPPSPPPLLVRDSSTSSVSSSKRRLGGKDVSALWNKSLTKSIDLIKEVSGAVDSFPKVALRPLEARLSRIAAGQDSKYPDRDFQAAVGEFQNKLVGEPFRSDFKRTGNIDELILAQLALRKSHPDSAWVDLLDPLIGQFAIAVCDCLKSLNVSGEVISRLDSHAQRFGGGASVASMRRASSASGSGDASGTVRTAPDEETTLNVARMRMVQIVGRLFGQSYDDLVEDVNELRHRCTEKASYFAAYNDLRRCINNIAQGAKFPANRNDFDSDTSYQQWRKEENTELSRLLLDILSRHPSLRSADDDLSGALVFVPSDVPGTYRRLVDFALNATPESDGMMSSDQHELLQACASRWRVTPPSQVNALLAGVVRCEAPMPYVDEALDALEIAESTWPYERWPWADRLALFTSLRALFDILLPRLAKIFQGVLRLPFEKIIDPLERIYSNEVFAEDSRDLSAVLEHLRGSVAGLVTREYAVKSASTKEKLAGDPPEKALEPLLLMLEWLMGECKRYSKAFSRPLFDSIDVPSTFIGSATPLWVVELEAAQGALSAVATRAPGAASDDDLLVLYENTKKLKKMHDAFSGGSLAIPFGQLFGAYVRRWISGSASTMSKVWVTRAIDQDKFEVNLEGEQRHSSSVTDIIEGCKASIRSLLTLEWPDEVESAQFNTRLSQAIANAVQIYARSLEEVFVNEINPLSEEIGDESWFTKARLAVQGGKKLVPFRFEQKLLVKLNNVAAMRLLLDGLSASLNAEKIGPLLEKHGSQIPPERLRNLFTIKIAHGERLIAADGSRGKVDSFVAIADEVGYQIARTRTAYETNDPRYEQSFDVLVKELPLVVSVYRPLADESPEVIGRARLKLIPSEFTPLVRRDLLLSLDGAYRQAAGPSRVLVRVRMEPEKDDIRFYFGRAFRALKRTEKEMARMVVAKMLPLIREYLSMSTLRTLLRTNLTHLIDLDRARGNLTTASRTVQGAALSLGARVNALLDTSPQQLIPDVVEYTALPAAPAEGAERRGPPTPQEVQLQAIAPLEPLVDYLNDQLAILAESLSPDAWALVSEQLWREILTTIESLILPPLSDEPTEKKPLAEKELDVIFRWLHFLVEFFAADGEGLAMNTLHGSKYRDLTLARMYYDMPTAELREEVVQSTLRQLQKSASLLGRSKSVLNQRNMKTIREGESKKSKETESSNALVILRILRMRPGQGDFVSEHLVALNNPVDANPALRRETGGQGRRAATLARSPPATGERDSLPPMPSLRETE